MRVKRGIAVATATAGIALGATVMGASPAHASAYGCTGFGPGVSFKGVYVVNGTSCGTVNGSGTWVNYIGGNAYNHIPGQLFCNWEFKADFYDLNGNWRDWASTGIRTGCTLTPEAYAGVYRWESQGRVVITFRNNGSTVAQESFAIYGSPGEARRDGAPRLGEGRRPLC